MADNFNDLFNTPDTSYEYDTQDIQSNKVWAVLAYLGILFFLPLVACKDSRFGKFHANQGFALFLTDLVLSIVGKILGLIPVLGVICNTVIYLIILGLTILGMVNAGTGKAKELPIIGGLINVFNK